MLAGMAKEKVPVSRRALIQRINRRLAKEDRRLCVSRGSSLPSDYHVVDTYRNAIVAYIDSLEAYGRETKTLADWERLEGE
jgi:hypothetical protein